MLSFLHDKSLAAVITEARKPEQLRLLVAALNQEACSGLLHLGLKERGLLEERYRNEQDPLLCAEIKRLLNRLRSRQILGRDLLRQTTPPVGDAKLQRLWQDLQELKTVYEEVQPAGDDFRARYDVLEEIGQGGMSVVFRGIRRQDGRQVAIKYLRREFFANPAVVSRFRGECTLALTLDHPHIISTFEAGEHDGAGFLVMEYLAGGGVDERLQQAVIPLSIALTVLHQTAEALVWLHARNIVHRDVKLANILLTNWDAHMGEGSENGVHVKLSDFGLYKDLAAAGQTRIGTLMGTEFYVAPEQRVAPAQADQRADIYSLGVCMYRLLSRTGFPEGDYPSLTELHPELPRSADTLLKKCLKVNREERLSSAVEFVKELQLIRNGLKSK